jgi:hypothetical protein
VFKDVSQTVQSFGGMDQIMKYAKSLKFPTSKQDLLNSFKNNNAPQELLSVMERLPDKMYNSPQDLIGALTGSLGK